MTTYHYLLNCVRCYRRFEAAEKVLSGSPKILIFGESGGSGVPASQRSGVPGDSAPHDAERHQ